jgi:hypothetical protein
MAPLHPATALTAQADMDVELPVNGLARDLDLVLVGDVGFLDRPTADRASIGQGCLVDLVDEGRWPPVGLGAVVLAGLAARLLVLGRGLALGEGGGLALAGAGRLVELTAEALILGLQVTAASLKGLAAGTGDGLHTSFYALRRLPGTTQAAEPRDQFELEAL